MTVKWPQLVFWIGILFAILVVFAMVKTYHRPTPPVPPPASQVSEPPLPAPKATVAPVPTQPPSVTEHRTGPRTRKHVFKARRLRAPEHIDCKQIPRVARQLDEATIVAEAKSRGATDDQIHQVLVCLGK